MQQTGTIVQTKHRIKVNKGESRASIQSLACVESNRTFQESGTATKGRQEGLLHNNQKIQTLTFDCKLSFHY